MKKTLFLATVAVIAMAGCTEINDNGNDNENDNTEQIVLSDPTDGEQTAWADDEEKGVRFTAKSDWEASVAESAASRANNVTWIKLLVDGEEKYSGGAGTVNIVIVIQPNTTGGDRKATITITCGGEKINISVDQKGVTEDNKPLTNSDLIVAHPWKHVISIYQYPKSWDNEDTPEDESVREDKHQYTYTFGKNGTVSLSNGTYSESVPYTVSGNTLTIHAMAEDGTPFDMAYTITKLTGNEFEGVGTFQGMSQTQMIDKDGNPIDGPIEYYNYTETIKFVKP